jgi:plastocyanin
MRRTKVAFAAMGVVGMLALPSAAAAHKYTAYAGEAGAPPKSAPSTTELNVFQPAKIKIRTGDKVEYLNHSFHTVSVLAKGQSRPAIALPVPGETYQGINDPNGNPFFFNGLQKFAYNPAVFGPVGNTTVGNGTEHSSGAFGPNGPAAASYTLKFAKPGTYRVLCLIHPGMQQKVVVLKAHAKGADSDKQVARRVKKESKRHYKDAAKAATKVPNAPATVSVGAEVKNATLLTYLPNTITVAKGTTVTFQNLAPSEVHNMTFGDKAYIQQFQSQTDLFPQGPTGPNQVSPPFVYASEPPTTAGTWSYSGDEYGKAFFWSPLMDDQKGDPPAGLPGTERITFENPGTYTYFCAIHGPSMHGTVVVTG